MPHPPIHQQVSFLFTTDLAATANFYEETLGLTLALDQGDCRIYRVSRDGFLGFCQRPEAPGHHAGVILTLVTPEVDRWHRYLSDQGVAFDKPPTLNPKYNIYHCFLRDPNGYLIEIQRFLDPAWPEIDQQGSGARDIGGRSQQKAQCDA
jgi:catechol 2,3-dioxygenase-like lactoylglutathione lyase family enzyme